VKNVRIVTLRPTRYKIGHFFLANLFASTIEIKPNTTKANIHPEHHNTTIPNKHRILKPDLVSLYNLRSGNGAGLFYSSWGPHRTTNMKLRL